jgi:hypothetical protein
MLLLSEGVEDTPSSVLPGSDSPGKTSKPIGSLTEYQLSTRSFRRASKGMNIETSEIDYVIVEDEEGVGGNRGAKSGEAVDLVHDYTRENSVPRPYLALASSH